MSRHTSPRRILSATPDQWRRWDQSARAYGLKWSHWARKMLELHTTHAPIEACGKVKGHLRCILERGHSGRHMSEPGPVVEVAAADIHSELPADVRSNGRARK